MAKPTSPSGAPAAPATPAIPVSQSRIIHVENINLKDPELAKGITQDAFEVLAKWISDLIGVRISKETLKMVVSSMPGIATVFSVFDLIDDIKNLATYNNNARQWGYQTAPPWLDTGLDVIGILPMPPFKQASMGLKSVVKMAFDPKFVFDASKQVISGMAITEATQLLEDMGNIYMPQWEPKIIKGFEKTIDGTIKAVELVAKHPGARAISAVYSTITRKKDPAEEIKDLLSDVRGAGDQRIKDVLNGSSEYAGLIPLLRTFTKNHKTAHSSLAKPAAHKRKAEDESRIKTRPAAPKQENVHEIPQTHPVATKARVNGKQNPTSAPDCKSCKTENPVNLATGEEILAQADFFVPGIIPVDFTRTYRSTHAADHGLLGARWSSPYTTAFSLSADRLTYHDAEGRAIRLPRLVIGEAHEQRFEDFVVTRESESSITLTYRNGDVDVFRSQGTAADGSATYALRAQKRLNGPTLYILPADEARHQFKDRPLATVLNPASLLVITDGDSLWLECHPAGLEGFAAESLAARKSVGELDALHAANERVGIAHLAGADAGLHPGAWRARLSRLIGHIDQLLPDGKRHTHVRYRYAPTLDERGTPLGLAAGLDLVEQIDAEGQARHYAYTAVPAGDGQAGDAHLLSRYTDYSVDGKGFGQNLEWESRAAWAPFPTRCTRTVADNGSEDTRLSYDTWFNETTLSDALGQISVFTYNADNLITGIETRRPDGSAPYVQRIWSRDGQLLKEIDPEGRTTRYAYDDAGNLCKTTDPLGNTTRTAYDAGNRPITITDPGGKLWQRQYDAQGNLTAQIDPAGQTTTYRYDSRGQLTGLTDARGGNTTLVTNASGQLVAHTDCSGKTTRYSYNALGQRIASTDASGQITAYETDRIGRIVATVRPDGSRETYSYDAAGRLGTLTNAAGQRTRYAYNGQGQLTSRTDANGQRLSYTYDAALQLIALANENGDTTTFTYDAQGNLIREVGFDGQRTEYAYNLAGHLIESRRGIVTRQTRIDYERDDLGRLLKKTARAPGQAQGNTTTYRYDSVGRLIAAQTREAELSYAYNDAGHLVEETQHLTLKVQGQSQERVFTLRHEVDALGNRMATTLPNGRRIETQRYGSGHWIGTLWNGSPLVDLERDDLHRETTRQLGTQAKRLLQTRHYDPLSRLERLRLTNAERNILATRTHAYDAAGNLTAIDDQRRGILDYRYDATGQLLQAVQPQLSETFAFDPAGNLTDGSPQGKATQANTAAKDHAQWEEGLEHLTEQPRGERVPTLSPVTRNLLKRYLDTSYTHDQEGNTIRKLHKGGKGEQPLSLDLHYDAENRLLKAVRQDGLEAHYLYDAFGRRIAKRVLETRQQAQATGTYGGANTDNSASSETLTCFVWDGDTLVQEVTPERTVSYLYEPESFVPLAQVISDTPASVYDPQAVSGRARRAAEIEQRNEDEAEKLKWLEVVDKAAAAQLKATLAERDRQEEDTERLIREREAQTDRLFYINTDHLGTPQEVVSDDGKIVWLARYKAWGRILKLDTAEIKQPFRFQGQYEDEETGLYYNRHRYYDPDSARFITQDPIGLLGGENLYRYAPNPTGWIDPTGLETIWQTNWEAVHGPLPQGYQVHHIIPKSGSSVAAAKKLCPNFDVHS